MRIRIQRGAALWEREWPDVEITNGDTVGREREANKERKGARKRGRWPNRYRRQAVTRVA
jgi:hypothetical protein